MGRTGVILLILIMLLGVFGLGTATLAQEATPGPAEAEHLGRFRAVLVGMGMPSQDGRCPALTVTIGGPGIATHMGNFTTEQEHCVEPTGANPLAFTNGLYTFTAADGSTISGRYNGQLIPTETTASDDLFMIEGRFTIEEGTGRFDGATGSGVADGLQNLTTGEASLVLDGTIAYPGLEPGGVGTPEASPAT